VLLIGSCSYSLMKEPYSKVLPWNVLFALCLL